MDTDDLLKVIIPFAMLAFVAILFAGASCSDKEQHKHEQEMAKLGCTQEAIIVNGNHILWKCPPKVNQ